MPSPGGKLLSASEADEEYGQKFWFFCRLKISYRRDTRPRVSADTTGVVSLHSILHCTPFLSRRPIG